MNIAGQSTAEEILTAEIQPLFVTISPQVIEELSSSFKKRRPRRESGGLLFGTVQNQVVHVRVLKPFPNRVWHASRMPEATLNAMLTSCRTDPQLSGLDWVGWFSVRGNGGLNEADLQFHNAHFRRSSDFALIVWPEDSGEVSLEFYSHSGKAPLTDNKRRRASLSVSRNTSEAVEVTLRDDESGSAASSQRASKVCSASGSPAEKAAYEIGSSTVVRSSSEAPASAPLHGSKDVAGIERHSQTALSMSSGAAAIIPAAIAPRSQREAAQDIPSVTPNQANTAELPNQHAMEVIPVEAPDTFEPKFDDVYLQEPSEQRRSLRWLAFGILSAVLTITSVAIFALEWPAVSQKIHTKLQWLQTLLPTPGLALRATWEPDGIVLTWDRSNGVVRSSAGAILQVEDGPHHWSLHLDAKQVANGSFLYVPATEDVSFLLKVQAGDRVSLSDSTRVLEASESKPTSAHDPERFDTARGENDIIKPRSTRPEGTPGRSNEVRGSRTAIAPAVHASSWSAPPSGKPSPKAAGTAVPKPTVSPVVTRESSRSHADVSDEVTHDQPISSPAGWGNLWLPNVPAPHLKISSGDISKISSSAGGAGPVQNLSPLLGSPTYEPPRPVRRILPGVARLVPEMVKSPGDVEVEVKIDAKGRVTSARIVKNNAKADAVLCNAVLVAARQWLFQPAKLHGIFVEADCVIAFQFRPSVQ